MDSNNQWEFLPYLLTVRTLARPRQQAICLCKETVRESNFSTVRQSSQSHTASGSLCSKMTLPFSQSGSLWYVHQPIRDRVIWCQGIYNILVSFSHSNLTHWGWVMHICVNELPIIGSDNGLSPGRYQDIIWTNDEILSIWTLGTNFSEILSEIHTFLFKKMHLKVSSGKQQPFCLGLMC